MSGSGRGGHIKVGRHTLPADSWNFAPGVQKVEVEKHSKPQKRRKPISKRFGVGRNDLCPCGSGKKYKRCCRG